MPDTLILDRQPLGRPEPAVTVDLTEARDRDLIEPSSCPDAPTTEPILTADVTA